LGVDDWAQCKHHRYGSVLVDLERRRLIAVLPDREAGTLAQWLQAHPGIEIVSRDRAGAYADGARTGAPAAIQVADRFHLVRNLAEGLQQVFEQHRGSLKTLTALPPLPVPLPEPPAEQEAPTGKEAPATPVPLTAAAEPARLRQQHRQERYEQVCHLAQQGWPFTAIAKEVGLHRKTVSLYVRAGTFPERVRPPSVLDPYKPYLLARWNAGCWTGTQLWQEIRQQGYRGKRTTALRYIGRLRQAAGVAPRTRTPQPTPPVTDPTVGTLTPRKAAWLVLRRPENLTDEDRAVVAQLEQLTPALTEAIGLAQEFTHHLRARRPEFLADWIARAAGSSLSAVRQLAKSFRRDAAAITAGLSLPWSTGPVEGHINRLKMVKRQMFGRAKVDLLASRLLSAA
jgi:transposase